MPRTLPRAAAVRAAADAASFSPQSVPPLALAVRTLPGVAVDAPSTQLESCVEVRVIPNPLVDALLRRAGAVRQGGRSYRLKVGARAQIAADAVAAIPQDAFALPDTGLTGALGPTLADLLRDRYARAPKRQCAAGAAVLSKHARGTVFLRLCSDQLAVSGQPLNLLPSGGRARPRRMTPGEAYRLTAAAHAEGIPVVDIDAAGRLDALWAVTEERLVVLPVPGRPAYATFEAEAGKAVPSTKPLPALDAVTAAERQLGTRHVAVHPDVADVARVSSAAGDGREGLYSFQDLFVSSYLASRRGLVNALEPGLGKTVCAAASMREKAVRVPEAGRYLALVTVPGLTLLDQWRRELGRFFPEAAVHVPADVAAAQALRGALETATGPHVVVASTDLLSKHTEQLTLPWDDLIVDEGAFLRNPASVRSEALWQLREHAAAAMVLTGTPAETSGADVVKLVAFARGDRPLLRDGVGSDVTEARSWLGPLVFHRTRADVGDELPSGVLTVAQIPAPAAEAALGDALSRQLADYVTQTATPGRAGASARIKVTSTLTACRLASTDPATFASSKYADQVRELASAAGNSAAKAAWVLESLAAWAANGQRVLVISDFAGALVRLNLGAASAGMRTCLVGSSQTPAQRAKAVADFTAGEVDVLMTSLVGQVGLNLQAADVVVHLDVPVSPTAMTQRVARAIRLGSTKPEVQLVVPVLAGTVEERLCDVLGIRSGAPWVPGAAAEGPVKVAARVARR